MTQRLVIPLGVSGLAAADFGFRFYRDATADAALAASLTVTQLGAGDYRVNGLPTAPDGSRYTLTWEYPAGAGSSFVYPQQDGAPGGVIVPLREAGLVTADLDLALYLDGVLRGDTLAAVELGSPGDYRVTGWPTDTAGSWLLVWRRAGLSFSYQWVVPATVSGTGVVGDLDAIETAVQAALVDETVAYLNRSFTPPQKTQTPTAPASFYTFEGVEWQDTDDADFAGGEIRHGEALIGCWVEPGCGEKRLQEMVDTARHVFDDADSASITFLRPTPEFTGFVERSGDVWYGWMVRTPFIAQG